MSQTSRKTKRKLQGISPPKSKAKGGKTSEADCLICEEPILEADDHCIGDEVVFCEGHCQGWLHRKCAGVTRPAFDRLGDSDAVYLCSYCMLVSQSNEISKLSNIITELNSAITSLTGTIKSLQSSVTNQPSMTTDTNNISQSEPTTSKVNKVEDQVQGDRKFNVVIYGINECGKGTPRHERLKHDVDKVTQIVTEGENSISPLSLRDLFRLGKYRDSTTKPRPVLVKLTRTIDVSLLLSKARSLPKNIRIKPDMTQDERLVESLLLKERWSLIQTHGIECKAIRIRYNKIFVHNKLHGQVFNSSYVPAQTKSSNTEMEDTNT